MKADDVAVKLRRAIRTGELPPGQELIQDEVARELGVSRIPLREALQSLTAQGVVVATPGRGYRVVELDADEVDELYRLRLCIEPPLAAEVVAGAPAASVTRLREFDEAMRRTANPEDWAQLNYLFHVELYRQAGAAHTLRIVRQLLDLVAPYSNMYVHGLEGRGRAEGEHTLMIEAIDQGDADALEHQIDLHLRGALNGILHRMKTSTSSDLVSRLLDLDE